MSRTDWDAEFRAIEASLEAAQAEAYRKRSRIYGAWMHPELHERLAEAEQLRREDIERATDGRMRAPRRAPDGRAPRLYKIFGYDIRITGEVPGLAWDTGPEPVFPFAVFLEGVTQDMSAAPIFPFTSRLEGDEP